jgi:hypothetical protein
MRDESPGRLRMDRRALLLAGAALSAPGFLRPARGDDGQPAPAPGLPGPYRGRVVEVIHPGSVVDGRVQAGPVREMVAHGMVELTGAADETAAWKRFFSPADVVAVKVCPVGAPLAISQPETLLEVFRGLSLAGVPNRNIILFNRYEEEMLRCGFDKILPPGVRIGYGAKQFDSVQTSLEGYDPEVFVEMNRVLPGQDPGQAVNRRSHLSLVVSRQVTKVVNISCLKDHASAGITMALKNISHGFVNNVARSHATASLNWCDTFIPDVVGLAKIREKVVLQIGDGLIGCYDGGPGNWNPHFKSWEARTLFFATDPVAMDRIGWQRLDERRAAENPKLPPLAATGIRATNPGHESFDHRHPQHVELAGAAGLGEADPARITLRQVKLD